MITNRQEQLRGLKALLQVCLQERQFREAEHLGVSQMTDQELDAYILRIHEFIQEIQDPNVC